MSPPPVTYPSSALTLCSETLPGTLINEDDWFRLSLEEQIEVLSRHAQKFAIEYFKCSIRHNIGSEAYKDSLNARLKWEEDNRPKTDVDQE